MHRSPAPTARRTGAVTSPRRARSTAGAFACGVAAAALACVGPAASDDTEVFFGQTTNARDTRSNVLFILDTSGSMTKRDEGQEGTRLERLQSAMHAILDQSTDINIGLMSLNGYNGGGPVRYPVTPVEQSACGPQGCGVITVTAPIAEAGDDTEERISDGNPAAGGNNLSIGREESGNPQYVGLRFSNLNIPQGATITGATLEAEAQRDDDGFAQITVFGHDADDAPAFTSQSNDLKNRVTTTSSMTYTPDDWVEGAQYTVPDFSAVVQEIVDRPGWCGGNALGLRLSSTDSRSMKSFERQANEGGRPVALRVSYDASTLTAGEGCMARVAISQVNDDNDDVEQVTDRGDVNRTSPDMELPNDGNREQVAATRFRNVQIPKDARILDATVEFEVQSKKRGAVQIGIRGEAHPNAPGFTGARFEVSNRPKTSASVLWTNVPEANRNDKVRTADLSSVVQEIVDQSGWAEGNALTIHYSRANNSRNMRDFESHDTEPAAAAKLLVTFQGPAVTGALGGNSTRLARDELKGVIDDLVAYGHTPLVSVHYEAAQYLLGGEVDFGRTRGNRDQQRYYRVSDPDSYTGGQLQRPVSCTDTDSNAADCAGEQIVDDPLTGAPTYLSPLTQSCQTSHVVFLSDGQANSNGAASRVRELVGKSRCDTNGGNEACGTELATWLYETDHNPGISQKQNIVTHTVAFNLDDPRYMKSLASAGGGSYKEASSASELVRVFQDILSGVKSVDTAFTAPGATVNQFNRLTHREDIYFAVFKPEQGARWNGNLKRYKVGPVPGDPDRIDILGADDQPAVDEATGYFFENAHSFWEEPDGDGGLITAPDGPRVDRGGAAARLALTGIPEVGDRRVATYVGDPSSIPDGGVDLLAEANRLHEDNEAVTDELLGIDGTFADDDDQAAWRRDLLRWTRGVDVRDEDADDDDTEARRHMGDPMHSRPVIVNYRENAADEDGRSIVYVATNEGFLHAIDSATGDEQWAFSPAELLENHQTFYSNATSDAHPYGLDGTASVLRIDPNEDFVIDQGATDAGGARTEGALLFVGMRRGGSNYYAFDISDPDAPKLAWVVRGGEGDFAKLGQSWSRATPARLRIDGSATDVLVVGGGYSDAQDPQRANVSGALAAESLRTQPTDAVGNAIFVLKARTGELLYTLSADATGDTPAFADMDYAIPGDVRTVDVDLDGFTDQLYAADMGGQVWRFDVNQYATGSDKLFGGGVIADLSGTAAADQRRFYSEPDVALVEGGGERFMAVSIGSGWRAHPLDTIGEDRFYVIRQQTVRGTPEGYGKKTVAGTWTPLTEVDLLNIKSPNTTGAASLGAADAANGWYADFDTKGEKVLSRSLTFNGAVAFTTFVPDDAAAPCAVALGSGRAYLLDVRTGQPARDLDGRNAAEDSASKGIQRHAGGELSADSALRLNHGGIPPEPAVLISESGKPILVVGPERIDAELDNDTSRTFWADTGPVKSSPSEDDGDDTTGGGRENVADGDDAN